jgi:hypothetical protein
MTPHRVLAPFHASCRQRSGLSTVGNRLVSRNIDEPRYFDTAACSTRIEAGFRCSNRSQPRNISDSPISGSRRAHLLAWEPTWRTWPSASWYPGSLPSDSAALKRSLRQPERKQGNRHALEKASFSPPCLAGSRDWILKPSTNPPRAPITGGLTDAMTRGKVPSD